MVPLLTPMGKTSKGLGKSQTTESHTPEFTDYNVIKAVQD